MPVMPIKLRGFTLIEMLMAIVVFALLSLSSATILQQTLRSNEISQANQERLRDLQRTMLMFEHDFGQMVARTNRNPFGEVTDQIFEYGGNYANSDAQGIRFYRLGWLNPQGRLPRGSLQQVIYRVENGQLQRQHSIYPDPVAAQELETLALLDEVLDLRFAFFINGSWVTQTDGQSLPQAIAVELELAELGVIRRQFLLPDGVLAEEQG